MSSSNIDNIINLYREIVNLNTTLVNDINNISSTINESLRDLIRIEINSQLNSENTNEENIFNLTPQENNRRNNRNRPTNRINPLARNRIPPSPLFINTMNRDRNRLSNLFTNLNNDNIFTNFLNQEIPPNVNDFLRPVIVRPSPLQINNATEVVPFNQIRNPQNLNCPITLQTFTGNDNVRRIKYCGHIFSDSDLMTWFNSNVRCPLCRYDIRNYIRGRNLNPPDSPIRNELYPISENLNLVRTLSNEESNLPENRESNLPENSQSNLPENSESNLPENSESNLPENSDLNLPENPDSTIEENIRREDNFLVGLTNDLADNYLNSMNTNPQNGIFNLEYTLFNPSNNTIYTTHRNNLNTDVSNNNLDISNNNVDN